jgi:hypothetical protein
MNTRVFGRRRKKRTRVSSVEAGIKGQCFLQERQE